MVHENRRHTRAVQSCLMQPERLPMDGRAGSTRDGQEDARHGRVLPWPRFGDVPTASFRRRVTSAAIGRTMWSRAMTDLSDLTRAKGWLDAFRPLPTEVVAELRHRF